MMTIIISLIVFMILIFIHELGHFLAAKSVGIKVNEFSIGMGPLLYKKQVKETQYSLRALPIGGYASMEGEDEENDSPGSFQNANVWSRLFVVAAGAIMNFLLAILVFTIVSFNLPGNINRINVTQDGMAVKYGVIDGDRIIKVNGVETYDWYSISDAIRNSKLGENIEIEVTRKKENLKFTIKPAVENGKNFIGITPQPDRNIFNAIKGGFSYTLIIIREINKFFASIFTGSFTMSQISGPIGVVKQIGEFSKKGIMPLLMLIGGISTNLGYFNLLPIPALDGGRIVFLILEVLRGKPISQKKEAIIHTVGFILLMVLVIFVSFFDVKRLWS